MLEKFIFKIINDKRVLNHFSMSNKLFYCHKNLENNKKIYFDSKENQLHKSNCLLEHYLISDCIDSTDHKLIMNKNIYFLNYCIKMI